jgi:hypothetical protein
MSSTRKLFFAGRFTTSRFLTIAIFVMIKTVILTTIGRKNLKRCKHP